ncbi:hypothetical protein OG589_18520 [Sphaerisporangium sp. NBC_01403]
MADAHGISAEEFLPYATSMMSSIPGFLGFYAPRIDAGRHTGDVDKLATGVAGVDHIVHATRDGGHAADSFASLVEIFKKAAG